MRVGTSGGVGIPGGTIVVTNRPLNGFLKPEHEIVSLGKAFKRPSSTDSRVRALLTKSCKDAGVRQDALERLESSAPRFFHVNCLRRALPFVPLHCLGQVPTVEGDTMSVDCFYEGQGRLDGAICGYDEKDKLDFLKRARDEGVRNIEMESSMYGAFCEVTIGVSRIHFERLLSFGTKPTSTHYSLLLVDATRAQELGIPAGCVCLALLNRLEGDQVDIPAEKYAKWMNDLMAVCVSFVGNLLAIKPVADSASASGDAQKQYSSVLSRAAAPSGTH